MNQAAVAHLGQISQLPDVLQEASISNDMSMIRIEQNGIVLEMAISCTTFATQGKKQRLISLKNIHSVLERNEMEAWQKLIRVLTHEIMNSITPIISLSETLSERGIPESLEMCIRDSKRKEHKQKLSGDHFYKVQPHRPSTKNI